MSIYPRFSSRHYYIPSYLVRYKLKRSKPPACRAPSTISPITLVKASFINCQEYILTSVIIEPAADTLVVTGTKGLAVVLVVDAPSAERVEVTPFEALLGNKKPGMTLLDKTELPPSTTDMLLVVVVLDNVRIVDDVVGAIGTASRENVEEGVSNEC